MDLRLAHIPAGAVDYLREVMPATQNDAGEREYRAYDYDAWLGSVFEY
jgi:Ca2+ insensitive EF hand